MTVTRLNPTKRTANLIAKQKQRVGLTSSYQTVPWNMSGAINPDGFTANSDGTFIYPPSWAKYVQVSASVLANGVQPGQSVYMRVACGSNYYTFVPATSSSTGWLQVTTPSIVFPYSGSGYVYVSALNGSGSYGELNQFDFSALNITCWE